MQWNPVKWSCPRRRAVGHQAEPALFAQVITGGRLRLRRVMASLYQAQQRGELWLAVPIFRCVVAAAEAEVAEAAAECCGESGHLCLTIAVDDDVSFISVFQDSVGHGGLHAMLCSAAEAVHSCLAGLDWIEAGPSHATYRDFSRICRPLCWPRECHSRKGVLATWCLLQLIRLTRLRIQD